MLEIKNIFLVGGLKHLHATVIAIQKTKKAAKTQKFIKKCINFISFARNLNARLRPHRTN